MKRNILKQELVNGVLYTLFKPKAAPKQLTAKTAGSTKHCGRTNHWGVNV